MLVATGYQADYRSPSRLYPAAFFSHHFEQDNKQVHRSVILLLVGISQCMLPFTNFGRGNPTLVLMPFLGGSQREWTEVVGILGKRYRCVTLDLPGFGAASSISGYSVSEMCDALIERIASLELGRYILIGHSMAGKVSAVATRQLMADTFALAAPEGLVLVAPSPAGPEPMGDEKRNEMLESLGNAAQRQQGGYSATDRHAAESYVQNNLAQEISQNSFDRTVDDVLIMNPEAWSAWLTTGSKEDWVEFVGVLDLPTLVVAGVNDKALGPDAQRAHTLARFSNGSLQELDCSHLIPLERPSELASLIQGFVEHNCEASSTEDYRALIASPRVSPQTRRALNSRLASDDPDYRPQVLDLDELHTLRRVMACVIPQRESGAIDLAARLDKQLAEAKGDGWRYATLPSDADACRIGVALLNEFAMRLSAVPFAQLQRDAQDSLLAAIASGRMQSAKLDLERWFEDLRANAVQIYVSHPNTLEEMGYSGIADDPSGFVQIGIGEREAWEPVSK